MNQKIHTGCSCRECKKGKKKFLRRNYHRLLRRIHKKELKKFHEIRTVTKSIGWTDYGSMFI